MKSTLAVLMVVFGMLAGPALGQAETWTLNPKGGDGIEIIKVTPRLNAGIPVPSRFRYRMEVKVRIRSAPAGTIKVIFQRKPRGSERYVQMAKPLTVPIKRNKGMHLVMDGPPVQVTSAHQGDTLRVVAGLLDARGKEVGYSAVENSVSGELVLRPGKATTKGNHLEILYAAPDSGAELKVGTTVAFTVKFYYNVASTREAFLNFEMGNPTEVTSGKCWYSWAVVLPQGSGQGELKVRRFLPNVLQGNSMMSTLALRTDPLGASVVFLTCASYLLAAGP